MQKTFPSLKHQAAFTLLEVLLALVIFASLSLGAYQVLQGVITNDALTKVKGARLADLQRVFTLLERDFSQMVPRPMRLNGEASKVVIQAARFQMESDDWSIAFVRAGWFNPGGSTAALATATGWLSSARGAVGATQLSVCRSDGRYHSKRDAAAGQGERLHLAFLFRR